MSNPFQKALEHHQAGRLREAEAMYHQALARQPSNSHAMYLLAAIAQQNGDLAVSRDLTRQAIAIAPNIAEYHLQLGMLLMADRDYSAAATEFRTTLKLRLDLIDAEAHLGNALYMTGDLAGAIEAFGRFLAVRPQSPQILNNLGTALREIGNPSEAIAAYRQALSLQSDQIDIWQNLGHTLRQTNEPRQAAEAYRKATELDPRSPQARYDRGVALKESGDLDGAIASVRQALSLRPSWPEALQLLGSLLHATARIDDVLALHEQVLENGKDAGLAAGLLHALYFNPACEPARIFTDHVRWNELYARHLAPKGQSHSNNRDPDRRLRIGYVSPDFRLHASSLFTLPLLSNHDRLAFEIFCYADVDKPDELTAAHRSRCDGWCDISKLDDQSVAHLLRSDRIDLLVDLSLHAAANRLLVFARDPAPVQLTWLAYPGTSGLETMDYRISDRWLDPQGLDERWYSEKTIRLPDCFWCYDPLDENPPVNELPALENGFVTFGSLNSFAKITPQTIEQWAAVLRAVPDSRMIVLAPRGGPRQRVIDQMKRFSIDPARIEFVAAQPRTPYLATFHRIDICLDTWPCPGHTTTLDSLWMGVPVLTRPAATAMSRGGVSILSNFGRQDCISQTPEQLVQRAVAMAADRPALANLRRTLRPQMRHSPLMDAPRFARNMEAIYRSVWQEWCRATHA